MLFKNLTLKCRFIKILLFLKIINIITRTMLTMICLINKNCLYTIITN